MPANAPQGNPVPASLTVMSQTVQYPSSGELHAGDDSTLIAVRVTTTDNNVVGMWAKIHAYGSSLTLPATAAALPGAGFTALAGSNMNMQWDGDVPVPVASAAATPPLGNNLTVTLAYQKATDPAAHAGPKINFKFIKSTGYIVDVHAWCCPWFAYTDASYFGPEGEEVGEHRPIRVRVPVNAQSVDIRGISGQWRHQANANGSTAGTSGPEGYGSPIPLYESEYQAMSANPVSGRLEIQSPAANIKVNRLVCLSEYVDLATASQIIDVGNVTHTVNGLKDFGGNQFIQAIHLGMWDGRQWNRGADQFSLSNSGTIQALFDWTVT